MHVVDNDKKIVKIWEKVETNNKPANQKTDSQVKTNDEQIRIVEKVATWAGENQVASSARPTAVNAPATLNTTSCAGQYEQRQQDRVQRRTEAFQQADTNKDGKVNLTEWLAFKPHDRGSADGQNRDRHEHDGNNLVEWLQKVDANHDGQISKAEAESFAPRIVKHFAEIDTDHNGLISLDELKISQASRKVK